MLYYLVGMVMDGIMIQAIVSSRCDAWIIHQAILFSCNGYGWDNATSYSI